MPASPNYALPSPALTAPPNVPADMQALANATDTAIYGAAVKPHLRYVADGIVTPQSIPTNTDTLCQFPVVRESNLSIMTVSGTGNNTFTTVKAGVFALSTGWRGASSGTEVMILVNGVHQVGGYGTFGACCSTEKRLAVNDIVRINVWHTSGAARSTASGFGDISHIAITRLGD